LREFRFDTNQDDFRPLAWTVLARRKFVAEHAFRARIKGADDPVEIHGNDGIVGRIEDRFDESGRFPEFRGSGLNVFQETFSA